MAKMPAVPMELSIAINASQLICTLIGNLLVCWAFYKVKSLRTPANVLLLSLAVADLLFVPVFVLNIVEASSVERVLACRLRRTLYHTLNTVVAWNLAAIGVDRLLAIKCPLRYKQMVTKKRAVFAAVVVWALAVTITALPKILRLVRMERKTDDQEGFMDLLFGQSACGRLKNSTSKARTTWRRPLRSFFFGVFPSILPYIMLFVAYSWISFISWRHFKHVKQQLEAVCPERKLQMKFAKTSAIVVGSFLILFSPLLLLATLKLFQVKLAVRPKLITRAANFFASNSAWLNPPIYAWRNRTYREAFRKLLKLLCLG